MKKIILCLLAVYCIQHYSLGQGCSDAGFCTMGAMKPSQVYTKKINFKLRALEVSYYNGTTTLSPKVNAATADFTFGLNEKTSMQLKLPYMWVEGNLGNTSGLGDISWSFTKNIHSTEKFHINATLGGKIPTNKSDLDSNVKPEHITSGFAESTDLPMYYQTSLGSVDIVAGGAFVSKKWMFATGVQIALTENENDFRMDQWENYPSQEGYLFKHDVANNLKRGTDFMLRVERAFHFAKWDVRLGLLPIWRISKDEILIVSTNEREKIDKTTGLALSTLLNVAYHFNTNNSVKLLYGLKLTDRDINPDGLTRDRVFSLAYVLRF